MNPNFDFYSSNYVEEQPIGTFNSNDMEDTQISWQRAFGTGGYPNEPPLFEELGINFPHMQNKVLAVLNPFARVDKHIMDDSDIIGPILFCFVFGALAVLNGKMLFGFIYGLEIIGCFGLLLCLNLMSDNSIDFFRTVSVLGYCLLPMNLLSLGILLQRWSTVKHELLTLLFGIFCVVWCTLAASSIFVSILQMKNQQVLVEYPTALLYTTFALVTIY